ncbi:MAG: sigma-70 family RNA polymerase sigma factor [Acidobacteriota bacterium]
MSETAGGEAQSQVTRLLADWGAGDQGAVDKLTPLVYSELQKIARAYLGGERHAQTLQPTELVHEAYLRLVSQEEPGFANLKHFFGVAARLMRQILADYFRRKRSVKRGGGAAPLPLEEGMAVGAGKPADIVALDDAMTALSMFDERKCRVIELRFFGGLSAEETAEALGISVATVGREQRLAEAWLGKEVFKAPPAPRSV